MPRYGPVLILCHYAAITITTTTITQNIILLFPLLLLFTDLDHELEQGKQSLDDILAQQEDDRHVTLETPHHSSSFYSSTTILGSDGVSMLCTAGEYESDFYLFT